MSPQISSSNFWGTLKYGPVGNIALTESYPGLLHRCSLISILN